MQHHKQCASCGAGFTAHRADARYCGPRCRTAAARKRTVPDAAYEELLRARDAINDLLTTLDQKKEKA